MYLVREGQRRAKGPWGPFSAYGKPKAEAKTRSGRNRVRASQPPLRVAGAFRQPLDHRRPAFVEWIEGDAGNVLGLSVPRFRSLLKEIGSIVTELWCPRRT